MAHLYKIRTKDQQVVTFKRNRAQKEFNETKHTRNIILKSRQLGFTTDEAIDSLDDTLFEENFEALMLSYDAVSQLDIFDEKINLAWDNLKPEIKALYTLDMDRANKLKFNWGNNTSSAIQVRTHGRSGTFNRVHISEFAKICKNSASDAREIISGTIPAVPIDGRVDIESTAEEDTGYFHDMFMEAWDRGEPKRPTQFKAHFFNWTYDDAEIKKSSVMKDDELPKEFVEYKKKHFLTQQQISYYYDKWITLARDWKLLHKEYPTTPEEAFESAGDKFFDTESVDKMVTREPRQSDNGEWKYFSEYKVNHRYGLGADVAEGIGENNSTIVIWDFDARDDAGNPKPEVVATYASDKIPPDMFAYPIRNGAQSYGNCIAAVERNNQGHATIAILKGIYHNIYKERKVDKEEEEETSKLGWLTTSVTKTVMLHDLKTIIGERAVNIPDAALKTELKSYLRDDLNQFSRDEGARGKKHWDRVIACAIGWQMNKYATRTQVQTTSYDGTIDPFNSVQNF